MRLIALKMLIGDKTKYIGLILGLSFASFIITQQAAIFVGLMKRTYGFITDIRQNDIWVMDPKVRYIDDSKPLKDTQLYRVRGIEGVAWAEPLYKGLIRAKLDNGTFQMCNVIGIDDATLIGGPPQMIEGQLLNLRQPDAVIVNQVGAMGKLAKKTSHGLEPLELGSLLELNDHRAKVVGICKVSRTFQSQPVIYTTYRRALKFAPKERKLLSFILVKGEKGVSLNALCTKIENTTGLKAYTNNQFSKLTVDYFLENTGIPLNFGVAVVLGFIIGVAVAGQTFYNFVCDNLRYLAVFKAMGADNIKLAKMTLWQAFWVGFIGWGIGIGAASIFGIASSSSELSFALPWQLFLLSAASIFFICLVATLLSLIKIFRLQPATVFQS